MRIGIDIDDTICYSIESVLPYICKYYNLNYEEEKNKHLSYEDYQKLPNYSSFAKDNYKYIMPKAKLKENADYYINKLSKLGNEIIFITARSNYGFDNPYKISSDYLKKNKIHYDKLIVGTREKGKVCKDEKIDIFIDDSLRNCFNVEKEGIRVLLFDNVFNKHDSHFDRGYNWQEIYNIIIKM